jgi:hypothetical protein
MFTSWKTTLAGIGIAILNLLANGLTPKQAGLSVAITALGALAKDFNVSHTPVGNTTPEAR